MTLQGKTFTGWNYRVTAESVRRLRIELDRMRMALELDVIDGGAR